ncbi:hypothetical protein L7F22_018148 [Adiantum nelumboides]|nr:hypothetical protein [Adiantum nelumboides]
MRQSLVKDPRKVFCARSAHLGLFADFRFIFSDAFYRLLCKYALRRSMGRYIILRAQNQLTRSLSLSVYALILPPVFVVADKEQAFFIDPMAPVKLPIHGSQSDPPNLFDGTTRLYVAVTCPYAQRAWSVKNYKGLDDIELVAIDLQDKPKWYLEKVYPVGKVPSLEHEGKVKGESIDVMEYIDHNFKEPSLFPKGSPKEEATKELLAFSDEVVKQVFSAFRNKDADAAYSKEHISPVLDRLEAGLGKFESEGPFFLGQLSAVDLAYAPFFERFGLLAPELLGYDIYQGRPKLAKWFKAINTVGAYTDTITYDKETLKQGLKKLFGRS